MTTTPPKPDLPEFVAAVLKDHTPTGDLPRFCPECCQRHPCDVHAAIQEQANETQQQRDRAERLKQVAREAIDAMDDLEKERDTLAAKNRQLREAIEALGAMPGGYCFCSRDRGPDKDTHEPECRDIRSALTPPTPHDKGDDDE